MRTIGVVLILLVELVVQSTFFPFINIGGIRPDLVLVTLLVISVFFDVHESWKYGLIIGLIKDILFGVAFGVYGLVYLATVLAVSSLSASIFKENVMAPLLMFPVGLILSNGLLLLLRYLMGVSTAVALYKTTWNAGYWIVNLAAMVLVYGVFKQLRQKGYLLDSTNI